MQTPPSNQLPVFHGCERGIVCNPEAPCFVPHPWSSARSTCLFASAYMRAEHILDNLPRNLSGEPTYREAIEVLMMVSLLNRARGR